MASVIIEEKNQKKLLQKMLLYILGKYLGKRLDLKSNIARKILTNAHPDIKFIYKQNDKTAILIDQIKEITAFISYYAYEASIKMVAIVNAQTMNVQAQNALLKSLEDHSDDTFFVLATDSRKNLLPTIQSRCSIVRPKSKHLEKIDISNLQFLAWDKKPKKKVQTLNILNLTDLDGIFSKKELNKREVALDMLNKTLAEERNKLTKYTQKKNIKKAEATLTRLTLLNKLVKMVEKNANPRLAVENYIIQEKY